MKLTDIKNSLNEISAIGGLKQVVKGNTDRVEGIKLSKEMAQAMIDWFNSSPYGRKYPKAAKGRLHLSLGIMSSMGLDRYAKHKGAKKELQYIKDLARAMRDNVNEESLNERDDAGTHLDRLADLVGKAKDFFAIGKELDKGGYKKKYFYSSTMMPMYQIEIDGFKFGIINKKYVDKGDREVGSTAIGLMESMKMNEANTIGKMAKRYKNKDKFISAFFAHMKKNYGDSFKDFEKDKKYRDSVAKIWDDEHGVKESINEAKYDIGMARKGNGLTVYNKAEEENGDYKNVAHIDNKGKIKYYDKKVPSKIKKQIEMEAKKMMEITKEGTMKLKDILKESFEKGKVYSNPFHTPFVKENESEESNEMTTEQKMAFLEAVKAYKSFGETVYRNEGLAEVYESIKGLVETAGRNMVKETEGSFDGITVGRHVKRMNESFKIFEKTLREVGTLQQRLESTYDEIGEVLGKYYEINETEEKDIEEGNEFGAARAKAIANGDSEFEVDGKKYPVKGVDKDDKDNAKEFANESKSMKLTSMLNESFGYGELPSEKLMKMKVSAKEMLASVNELKEDEIEIDDETEFKVDLKHLLDKHKVDEGYSTEEKRIVLLAVRKLMKYKNIDINLAAQYVVGAAEELKMDIDKGRVKK